MKPARIWPGPIFDVSMLVTGSAILSIVGALWLAPHLSDTGVILTAGASCLALTGLLAIRQSGGLGVLLLGVFSIAGGALVAALLPVSGVVWRRIAGWSALAAVAGGVIGALGGTRLIRLANPLWLSAWVYPATRLLVSLMPSLKSWERAIGLLGVVGFSGLMAVCVVGWRISVSDDWSGPAEAARLLVILANLMLSVWILAG